MESWIELLILPPIAYTLLQGVQQGRQMAVLQTQVSELNSKLNLFLKTEMDSLKDIVNQNTQALKNMARP